ncbi:SCO family protein [Steroidobacter denitrificans]|nr:SCO family protein [Steroidobacter denitrificans]
MSRIPRIPSIALAIVVIVAVVAGMLLSRALLQSETTLPVLTAGTLLDPPKPLPPMAAHTTRTAEGASMLAAGPKTDARASMSAPVSAAASSAAGFVDQDRQTFDLERLEGHWSLMFFGFTNCPDICPMTLGTLAQTEKQLMDLPPAQRPQVILVSVDARRDTPEQLATYVKFFSPSFTGITAPQEIVEEFARRMGVVVAIAPIGSGGIQADGTPGDSSGNHDSYTVDHSTSIFLIDPHGAMRALFSPAHSAAAIAADYRRVIAADRRDLR